MNKQWCISKVNSSFIACMERILWLYSLPYNPKYPVLCFDERPCFLIGDRVAPIQMQSGKVRKEHYSYEKNGYCCLLMVIEPLTGKRFAQIFTQRRKKEYAQFMRQVASLYPEAKKIRLVQDNLNTHSYSSFYENMEAEQAFDMSQKFEFYFTPKSASWLNMVEIEFSALSKQCLYQRIATKEELEQQVMALIKEREEKQIKINWQFSLQNARDKFDRHYRNINK